jgi:histidine triad (HIT) family protein
MPPDPDCIFCKIVAKEIPAGILYEHEACLAFLDINPLAEGHILVIPREHYVSPLDMPGDVCGALFSVVPTLGRALIDVTAAEGFNVLLNSGRVSGQVVMHAHVHLIPRRQDDGLGYRWNAGTYPPGRDAEVLDAYRQALADQR